MAGLIHELLEILEQQKECYEGLLTLAKYKTDSIVDRNMEILDEVLKREQEFVGRAARLEKNRETILEDISVVLNLRGDQLTISNLISKLDKTPEEQAKLAVVREKLLDIAGELKNQNATNEALLAQSLEFIDFTLNALQSMHSYPSAGYKNQGDDLEQASVSFFDRKQ